MPGNGKVFIDGDYSQIELVVLAYILKYQFKLGSSLHDLINEGHDIHQFIAAAVLDKNIEDVTKAERNGAKAVSFGRPGGMGVAGLQRYAKNSFKQDLPSKKSSSVSTPTIASVPSWGRSFRTK